MRHEPSFRASDVTAATWLTVPGLCSSGPTHWQSLWEAQRDDTVRVALPDCDDPDPNAWIHAIDRAVRRARGPVLFIAHSLGCQAVVGWAHQASVESRSTVVGALLVAPPDVSIGSIDPRIRRFASVAAAPLPFPALLLASRDDPFATIARSRCMAQEWGVQHIDMGNRGHINADSGLADWTEGQKLAERMCSRWPRLATLEPASGAPL